MANEHYFLFKHRYSPSIINALAFSVPTIEMRDSQTGTEHQAGIIDIGTSEETISWSTDIGDEKWLVIRNLDTTNYIQLGFSTGVYGMRLTALDFAVLPLEPGTTLYALANTASCKLQYFIYEA